MSSRIVTIVGVGLIGGSIGLALKKRGLAREVRGLGRRRESLDEAKALGAIDAGYVDPAPALANADLVVLCTPVDQIAEQAIAYARLCKPGVLLTDAGSTKYQIVTQIEGRLPSGVAFVGSHPLAGSERKGPAFADAELFQDRWTVVTPTTLTDATALAEVVALWTSLGSRVKRMSPAEHDQALALTSHLPHLIASALAGLLPADLVELAASGFRDTTRIAAGDSALWLAIFEHNRSALLTRLADFESRIAEYRRALEQRDPARLRTLWEQGKDVRDGLGR